MLSTFALQRRRILFFQQASSAQRRVTPEQETTYHGDHGGHGEGVASPSRAGHQPQRSPTFVPSDVFGFVSVLQSFKTLFSVLDSDFERL